MAYSTVANRRRNEERPNTFFNYKNSNRTNSGRYRTESCSPGPNADNAGNIKRNYSDQKFLRRDSDNQNQNFPKNYSSGSFSTHSQTESDHTSDYTSDSELDCLKLFDSSETREELELPAEPLYLNSKWKWYFLRNDVKEWDQRLEFVQEFQTIQEFWSIYSHIKLPSSLPSGCDYMIFKSDIEPHWDNDTNLHGGRWLMELDRCHRNQKLDSLWLETLLAMIGEQLEKGTTEICGAVVQSRRQRDRVSLWTRDAENESEVFEIGNNYKRVLNNQRIKYQTHESNTNRISSHIRYKYTL
jgi:translation initiation factor 4E